MRPSGWCLFHCGSRAAADATFSRRAKRASTRSRDYVKRATLPTSPEMQVLKVESLAGLARVYLHAADPARAALVLGHGAGGGVEAADLVAAREAALAEGVSVGLVEQPYRVAGRRSPAAARQLDAAWLAVVSRLRERELRGLTLVVGGRSLGARVACRTASLTEAVAVLCLAFPLRPPGRSGSTPRPSRLPELDGVAVPVLVVQGARDPFGMPPATRDRTVVEVAGDHSLKADLPGVSAAVRLWLADLLPGLDSQPATASTQRT